MPVAVAEPVLGDHVALPAALAEPGHHLRRALAHRVHVPCGDHQQGDAIDLVVRQPVADQGAALERRGLDAVDRHGDRAPALAHARLQGHGREMTPGGDRRAGQEPQASGAAALDCSRQAARPLRSEAGCPWPERTLWYPTPRRSSVNSHVLARAQRSAEPAMRSRRMGELTTSSRLSASAPVSAGASRPLTRSSISESGPPSCDGHHRKSARLCLEDHLTERVGLAREEEHVGARVGAGELPVPRAIPGTWPHGPSRSRRMSSSGPPPARIR